MIKEVDVDGDGRIDFYEFVHALGEPEDSQENDDEEETSPLPTPKSTVSLSYEWALRSRSRFLLQLYATIYGIYQNAICSERTAKQICNE